MEVNCVCKHCKCVIDFDNFKSTDPSFEELVNNCKAKQQNCDQQFEELGNHGVIKWLLTNATETDVSSLDIDKIVDNCALRKEQDMVRILEQHQVYVKNQIWNQESYKVKKKRAIEYALEYGNPEIISWLLKLDINIEARDGWRLNSLMCDFIKSGQLNNVIAVENLGGKSTIIGTANESLLIYAAKYGQLHIVKWMYDNKMYYKKRIPKSYVDDELEQALYEALINTHYHVVEYIIENTDVNLNYKCNYKLVKPIVHVAADLNNVSLVKYLVDNKANLFTKDTENITVAHIAAEKGNLSMLKWLSTQDSGYKKLDCKLTLLHIATLYGHYECVEYLVHMNYAVESKNKKGQTVLQCAVQSGNVNIVKLLITHGLNVNVAKELQDVLVLDAHKSLEMIKFLVSQGFNLNARNSDSNSVLNLAACCNNYDAVKWLLEQGMDITEVVKDTSCWLEKTSVDNCRLLLLCMKYMKEALMKFDHSILEEAVLYPESLKLILEHNYGKNYVLGQLGGELLIKALEPKICEKSLTAANYLLDHGADVKFTDEDRKTALYNAISSENMPLIKKLIELGSDVNAKSTCRSVGSILNQAIKIGNMEVVKYLVEMGANIHARNMEGYNAINVAGSHGKWDIVKYFVELGVNINNYSTDSYSSQPILYVANYSSDSDIQLISWLLEHGANPNIKVRSKEPILHEIMSIKDEHKKLLLVKLLVEHGANVNEIGQLNRTVLFHCLNNANIVDCLIEAGIDINAQDIVKHTALHTLLEDNKFQQNLQNNIKVALKLINHGTINVNAVTKRKETLLHYAVRNSNCEAVVKKLIEKGCDINARNWVGNSVLHVARDVNIAMFLIKAGANINVRGKKGATILKYVLKPKYYPRIVIKKLNIMPYLQSRIVSNNDTKQSIADHYECTIKYSRYIDFIVYLMGIVDDSQIKDSEILQFATTYDNVRVVEAYFKRDTNILTRTDEGNSVLHLAANEISINVVTYIFEHMNHELLLKGNDANETPLHIAINPEHQIKSHFYMRGLIDVVHSNKINIVKLLLEHGVDIEHKTNRGLTALHIACLTGELEIVKLLLEHGADINACNHELSTPIFMAIRHYEVFKYLVTTSLFTETERLNLLKCKNKSNQTLLHIAVPRKIKVMQCLLDSKIIPIDSVDKLGNSALHNACSACRFKVVKLLLENGANVNLKNKCGDTPLHVAAKESYTKDIVQYLIQNGANFKAKNKMGEKPIDVASYYNKGSLETLEMKV